MSAEADPTESELCLACGMCCDNTLFGRVISSAEEAPQLRALGIQVIEYDDGEFSFNQRCPRLRGFKCEVYQSRPHTCQSYVCETINALRDGTITGQQAQSRITQTLAAKRDLALAIGDERDPQEDQAEARARVTEALGKGKRGHQLPGFAPQAMALERLLDRWFREDSYKTMTGYDDI
ncbi:hypothetical protein GCM10009127_21790 [Alteraurantiacibacter aestuarii]|uniref:YkgJ family cysteine cluster protein n=1 Tax=Alteraurantiacibacter aestuarii TaxID=650004 RepID=UPI0031D49E55